MANRLDTIELDIADTLKSIDGLTTSLGYTYYTTTGSVQLFDENLSLNRNTNNKMVNHYIEQSPDQDGIVYSEFQVGQWASTNESIYEIRSKLHNTGTESNAKNAIRSKMNDLLDDLLYAFGNRFTLGGRVSYIQFLSATREYEDVTNNRIQSATLVTKWKIVFTQSIANPSTKSCA